MTTPKIVVIGAGSASFGLNTLATLIRNPMLKGSLLALVDQNDRTLEIVATLAQRLNREWDAQMSISTHTHHQEALPGAHFVIQSIEVSPRETLWRSDFEIPLKYGVRQPYGENGGPGGFAHTARNTHPVLQIAHAMESLCPDAWLINFTNPMTRICDAIARYSRVKVIGLCHQILAGYAMVGKTLAQDLEIQSPPEFTSCHADLAIKSYQDQVIYQALERIHIQAAGLNHFTWMLSLTDQRTGEDLYPLFAKRWAEMPPTFEPLTRRIYDIFGVFPIPGDEHLCEYLPWLSDPITKPWQKFDISLYDWDGRASYRQQEHARIDQIGNGALDTTDLMRAHSEGAAEIIEHITQSTHHELLAANLPNQGQISNLPNDAIVETPAQIDDTGLHAVQMGNLPEPIAELCRRELSVVRLSVDAAVNGDRQAALQCLLLDPVVTDLDTAQHILDDYLSAYRQYLPQFFDG